MAWGFEQQYFVSGIVPIHCKKNFLQSKIAFFLGFRGSNGIQETFSASRPKAEKRKRFRESRLNRENLGKMQLKTRKNCSSSTELEQYTKQSVFSYFSYFFLNKQFFLKKAFFPLQNRKKKPFSRSRTGKQAFFLFQNGKTSIFPVLEREKSIFPVLEQEKAFFLLQNILFFLPI